MTAAAKPTTRDEAREPQRERGKQRVAALLQAATAVFAEKGFDAATMTEIAARAGAPIGSLYQFFPNKDALADALMRRYAKRVLERLEEIEAGAATLPLAALGAALLETLLTFSEERAAAMAMVDVRRESKLGAQDMRMALRQQLVRVLRARDRSLTPARVTTIAATVQMMMKTAVTLAAEHGSEGAVMDELRDATRLYLASRLAG
ncbi:MAG: TetR/AcrR family transcriptional regulator [Solimonas sp.]